MSKPFLNRHSYLSTQTSIYRKNELPKDLQSNY